MVDVKMTVRGYMALYVEEMEAGRACWAHNPPRGTEAFNAGVKHFSRADEYRAKAYDLMGVNTINQPEQLSFFEAL